MFAVYYINNTLYVLKVQGLVLTESSTHKPLVDTNYFLTNSQAPLYLRSSGIQYYKLIKVQYSSDMREDPDS